MDHIKDIKPMIIEALEEYRNTTKLDIGLYNYDFRDMYFWEQRMPTWHSQVCVQWDYATETFIAWNARAILTAILEVPVKERKEGQFFKAVIKTYCPEIANIPINPPKWPL